jgi:MoxR-like ATPase
MTDAQQQLWQIEAEKASGKISDAEHSLKVSRSSFHGALPHNFVDAELPALIEQSISSASDSVTDLKIVIEKSAFRISQMSEYFA